MKILVTGGTGYIGSHTVVELQQKGYETVIVDDLSNSSIEVLDAIEKITGIKPLFGKVDLKHKEHVKEFIKEHNDIKAVIHFAASKAVGESVENPLKYYENNIASITYLLKELVNNNINLFVFSSSCTVYGEPDILPIDESAPIKKAESPYGNTKKISEDILLDLSKASLEFKVISLRYFNPIGAHDSALIGELPVNEPNNLCPVITRTAIGKRESFDVFGTDYDTPDGSCIRDYIHVVDLAKAHVLAIERLINNKNKKDFEVFNLGTGTGYSVLEVINEFERITNQKVNYKISGRRPGDVVQIYADTRFANKELGWKAERNLSEMLESAWMWEKYLKENETRY